MSSSSFDAAPRFIEVPKPAGCCKVDGCHGDTYSAVTDVCFTHGLAGLVAFIEQELEGDTLADISSGEQIGAWLRAEGCVA